MTSQVTPEFEGSLTVAENCCVPLDATVALVGETDTLTDGAAVGAGMVTVAFALLFPAAAVTVTEIVELTVAGALYNPVVLIVPMAELPP